MSSLGTIYPEVLEKKTLKFVNAFELFCNYLPFEKSVVLESDALCQIWLKLAQWLWRKRLKCEVYRRTDGWTDRQTDGRQVIRKAHLSFHLRLAKNTKDVTDDSRRMTTDANTYQ